MKNAKDMLINSVKLVNQGLKGIEVKYSLAEKKNSRSFIDEHTSKKKAPIHTELDNLFVSLKPYLLEICGYDYENEIEITETEVVEISYIDKGFYIKGKKEILGGHQIIDLNTKIITDDMFPKYKVVSKIMNSIYDEVRSYMAGEKTLSDEQLVLKFNENKGDFNKEAFFKLTKAEQREMATKALEEMGAVVIHEDEFTTDIIEEDVIIDEKKTPCLKHDEATEEEERGGLKIVNRGEHFQIVATPIKQSTAKKVA